MKNILIIGTGGTIASKNSGEGLKPALSTQELLGFVPEVLNFANITSTALLSIDSTNMQPSHWIEIASCIKENYDNYDGFVITHGTDTMAYTSAALSYLIQNSKKPVVITGAQKPIDLDITDAKTNLFDSIRFACCDKAYGVNIVFDGKVIAGTRARKERTKSYNAFSSINFPYIAIIQEDRIIFYIDDKKDLSEEVKFFDSLNTRIILLKLIPGMDAHILEYMAIHHDAVIIESFGVGGLPSYADSDFKKSVENLVKLGKTVVMTTQAQLEGSHMSVYEVGKSMKEKFGLLESFDMTLEACVSKLMWILAQTDNSEKIRELFYTTIGRDILLNR